MPVIAKKAQPGSRYRTAKGVVVEMAGDDKGRLRQDDAGSTVLAFRVNDAGEIIARPLIPIPFAYPLIKVKRERVGRPLHKDKTWRGWAYKNPEYPRAVLRVCTEAGCYLKESANYLTVGHQGRTILAVFRSGQVGFKSLPQNAFVLYRPENIGGAFMPVRLNLNAVKLSRALPDFKDELTKYLQEVIEK